MTHRKQSIYKSRMMALITAFALISFIFSGCTKKSDSGGNDAAKFIGSWNGTSTCSSGGTGTATFSAGSDGSTFTFPGTVGDPGCTVPITVTAHASGNSFTVNSKTYTDGCGNSYTMSGSGTLSGSTLTFTMNFTGTITATCTFTGTK